MAAEAESLEEVPPALVDCPSLSPISAPLLAAFFALSASRSLGFAIPDPIRPADALAYWSAAKICDALYFLDVIRALDAVWLQEAAARAEAKKPKK